MRDYVFWMTVGQAVGLVCNVIVLATGKTVTRGPFDIGFSILAAAILIAVGISLLAKG